MYPVDLHMHTVASTHAYSTLHDYIAQAKRKGSNSLLLPTTGPIWPMRRITGILLICVSGRGWWMALAFCAVSKPISKIPEGEIDCTGPMLNSLDLIIAGFHEPVFPPQDKATHTEAMIATIASGAVHIISHPGNPKFPVDIPAIAAAAAKHHVALEINNSSFVSSRIGSEDNCRAVAAAVRDAGGWVALGSDSHTAFTLGEFSECRKILDAVGFPEERILNVTPRRLLNFLESRGMPAIPELAEL